MHAENNRYIYRLMEPSEYGSLEGFMYEVVFVPAGAERPPRDIVYKPSIHRYFKDFGADSLGDFCYVCVSDTGIVGAAWSRILDKEGETGYGNIGEGVPELAISVLPEYRKQGIGTQLIKRLHETLGEAGHDEISLSVVKENDAARLYQRLGYRIIAEKEDDYIMVCGINAAGS